MSILHGKKIKLFSLSANKQLAEEISKSISVPLSDLEVRNFADGEIEINILESVRGHDCFIVQPTNDPVNEHYMELLIMCDALKRASAKTICVIMPYYGYSRQDRKAKSRQPISAKLMADLIQIAGATRVICMDLHAGQIQGFFNIPIDNFPAAPMLANYFIAKNLPNIVVISPDHGGATRARKFAKMLDAPMAIIDKRRPAPNVAEVMNIIGEVSGHTAIIIDDIIDTAGTLAVATEALLEAGALGVYAAATHALFSGDAYQKIKNSKITEVVVTNTVKIKENLPKITQLSIGSMLGEAILHIVLDEPISQIFNLNKGTE